MKKKTKTSGHDFSSNTIDRLLNKLFFSKSGICKAQNVRAHVRFERNSVSSLPHSFPTLLLDFAFQQRNNVSTTNFIETQL